MQKYKKTLIVLMVLLVILVIAGKYLYYGSLFRNCEYTQQKIDVPEKFKNGYFLTVKKSTLMYTEEAYDCLPYFRGIDNLVSKEEASDSNSNNREENFPPGIKLKMVDVVSVTKHGMGTIDSGPGPFKFYILEDEAGKRYSLWTPINDKDYFALFFSNGDTEGMPVNYSNFEELID